MRITIFKLSAAIVLGLLVGCATPSRETKWFEDSQRVRGTDSLEEIALTLPVFESGDPRATLRSGGYRVTENTAERWRLLGDGGQAPVLVVRVSPRGEEPVIVRVTQGPAVDGITSQFLLKRYASGWERSEFDER